TTVRQTWVRFLWPYIEQTVLTQKDDPRQPFYLPPCTIPGTMNGLCGIRVPLYYCPSDNGVDLTNHPTYSRTRGNYVVNWASARYGQNPQPAASAPFAHLSGNRSTPKLVRITDVTDGSSNTLLLSETLMAKSPEDNDWRGDIHNDDGHFRFQTLLTPNS